MSDTFADTDVTTITKTKLKAPSLYKVVFHNDDFTPFDFVIAVLMAIFEKSQEEANLLALTVHKKGRGVAGIYTKEIADSKRKETVDAAKQNKYPLKVTVEED